MNDMVRDNIMCPDCYGVLDIHKNVVTCKCGSSFAIKNGTPIFISDDSEYVDQINNQNYTNPYSPKSLALIRNNPDSVILDFGAGNPKKDELFDNVIRMDFLHYKSTHIVSNKRNIPFKDESFDYVITESVFEHVRDPWHYASELHRVLKKGGEILVDTAFLQPVHGDPYHFYNMTVQGVKETFKMFVEIQSGVEQYQTSGTTMNIITRQFMELLQDDTAKNELQKMVGSIDFASYDRFIPIDRQSVMSAGVFFVGVKN